MPQTDGVINSSNLCSQAVVERILGDNAVTSVKIYNNIQSDNFSAGSAGWRIERNTGSVEFQDAVIRGTLNASDITAGTLSADFISGGTIDATNVTVTNLNASNISSGTLSADRIAANSLSVGKISGGTYGNSDITFSSGSDLISSNYVASTSGWKITGAGVAEFQSATITGSIAATSGSLSGLSVSGTLTLSGSGLFRTAGSGQRIEMTTTDNDRINFYSGQANETVEASIRAVSGATGATLYLQGPQDNGSLTDLNFIEIHSEKNDVGGMAIQLTSLNQGISLDGRDGGVVIYGSNAGSQVHAATFVGGQIRAADGSATVPVYSFLNDTNTGIYSYAAGDIGFTCDGTVAFTISQASTVSTLTGNETNDWIKNDSSTEQWRLGIDNVTEMTLGSTGFLVPNVYNNSVAGTADVLVESDGSLRRATSSERYKRNIVPFSDYGNVLDLVPIEFDELASEVQTDDNGKPIRHTKGKNKGQGKRDLVLTGRRFVSLSAEKAADASIRYAKLDADGRPEAIEWNAITASLIGVVKDLRDRVDVLEG